jgi:hypothetical protein
MGDPVTGVVTETTGATGTTPAPVVSDLRIVAITPDRTFLVLEDSENKQYRVPVDERLANALRTPDRTRSTRDGQLEIALESQLSPREIQARVRAGHSVDEVAVAAGIATERVERYAVPVLAERAHVVEQAQRAPARRATAGKAPALVDLVEARLVEQGVPAQDARWDAWRGDEERWTVRVSYLGGGRERVASWAFDPRGRVLAPTDDEARWLVDDPGSERLLDDQPAAIRRLAAVPHPEDEPGETTATAEPVIDEVYDREADEARAAVPAAATRGRRPSVPAWEDIMFGPRRRD